MSGISQKTTDRLFALQRAVQDRFPVSDQPIELVSSNGDKCEVCFLNLKDGFFIDPVSLQKISAWYGIVLSWLQDHPGAALTQSGVTIVV